MGVQTLLHVALLKMLVHSLRYGHVEGVRMAIEKGVNVKYIDKRSRNLLMLAIKYDTDARLRMCVILADAGCDINHTDARGWSCLHYACATGALDVVQELTRRGVAVEYNIFGFGFTDLSFPRIQKARSLLQHTEQLSHEIAVRQCWTNFDKHMHERGYGLSITSFTHEFKKPLKVRFEAPMDHSTLDRIRIVDLNSEVPMWEQMARTIPVPPGNVGCIVLDHEVLDKPSIYRIYYEQYRPNPVELPAATLRALEDTLCVKDLDSGQTVSVKSVNDLVLKELNRGNQSELPESHSLSSTRSNNQEDEDDLNTLESCSSESEDWDTSLVSSDIPPPALMTQIATSGVHRFAAMVAVSIVRKESVKAPKKTESFNTITITFTGPIGLSLEGVSESKSQRVKIVVISMTQAFKEKFPSVNVGDCLVRINQNTNVEYTGLRRTVWELGEATRPMELQFRQELVDRPRFLRGILRRRSTISAV
ncbi:hypothetical protein THRCLA_06577 [Thraustotheca clavata]|uniref:Uncharacterized protein n=1 Tax=Thraustotheca clavata TaxID=74557 RepID=A0A1V9ZN31_9STRA|nr:hypothetical protein THRCLA_06577 [Thraustotheca clavata]